VSGVILSLRSLAEGDELRRGGLLRAGELVRALVARLGVGEQARPPPMSSTSGTKPVAPRSREMAPTTSRIAAAW
jgi:hypothetical protein